VLLFLERTFQAGASIARARRLLDDTVNYLRNYSLPACRNRELIRHRLAGLKVEIEVGRLAAYRAAWFKQRGLMPESVASTARVYSSRIEQGTARTIMGVLGLFGQLKGESPHSRLRGAAEHLYLCSLSDSILGGTTQIQKNIIALRGLGLPR
ncbi:MAG: acyl-CoA dehydrogenase family protein, partial [Dehalococcoidia bacterium]|nr:acyl-CoA dehydrogenase family protein [Dehalococcoidia bacterium]